jgi:O-antigen/teichoic acid export membrane protein
MQRVNREESINKEGSKVSSFIKGSSILVLSNICLKAINFFLLPLYTNNLTPSMIGISDSITTLTGIIMPLLTMGLDSAYSAFYFDKNDSKRAEKVFSTLTWMFLLIGWIPFLIMIAAPQISSVLFHTKNYSYIIRFALISVSFNLWYLPYSLELRLKNKMFLYGLSNVIVSLAMVALNILFVSVLHLGEAALVLSTMIVHAENLLILILFVRRKPQKKWFDSGLLKQMLKFAIPLIPMTLMLWVLSLSDRYVLLYYHGESSVGLYGIGLRFTNLMNVVISAVSMAYTTFAFSSKEDNDSKKQYFYIFNVLFVLLVGIAFTLSLFGKEIVQLMTAESYGQSYLSLRDLMFSQVFYAMTSIVGYGIYFEKRSEFSLIAVSAGAVLNLVLNFILIPKYGISAAALTTLLGYALNFFLTLYFSEKLYPCQYGQGKALISLLVLYIICLVGIRLVFWIRVCLWVVCFVGMVFAYRNVLNIILHFVLAKFAKNRV